MPWPVHPTGFLASRGDEDSYKIERSLRFNSADSAYLSRTPASAGNRKTWTLSFWTKRTTLGTLQTLFSAYSSGSVLDNIGFTSSDAFTFDIVSGSQIALKTTTQVFRDTSSWYHFVVVWDSTNGTATNRIKLYVNGSEITNFASSTNPNLDTNTTFNNNVLQSIGQQGDNSEYSNGYLTEINFIDGQALPPSSFGETDAITGRWKAKAYSGTYGTNGFYLKFADNSGTTATTLGKDSSGNGNNWTPNNFSVTAGADNDSLLDSPTNNGTSGNYATLVGTNSVASNIFSYANGNLDLTQNAATPTATSKVQSTIKIVDKTYFEVTLRSVPSAYDGAGIGVFNETNPNWGAAGSWFYTSNGDFYNNGSYATSWGSSFTNGDILGCAVDPASGKIWFSKNGVWQASGNPSSGSNPAATSISSDGVFAGYVATPLGSYSSGSVSYNFGQRPFAYTAPTGFRSLCTTNLPQPTIQKPSKYMDVVTWTGNGNSSRSITGFGFSPDLIWMKGRSGTPDHALIDTVRGTGARVLSSNQTSAENDFGLTVTSFDSGGFTVGSGSLNFSYANINSATYVAWAWDEAPIAGMDIVSYTGNGTTQNISHSLGVAPKMIIVKSRSDSSTNWTIGHASLDTSSPWGYYLYLDSTSARMSAGAVNSWGNNTSVVAPTSSVFTIGNGGNLNSNLSTYIAYLFAEVEGFSKFGSYTGNGSSDGPFVWCGFRPRWVMVKLSSSAGGNWVIRDALRDGFNVTTSHLFAENGAAETSGYLIDFTANGFKVRDTTNTSTNGNGNTYIFAAFAESPFKYARAR